MKLIINQKQVKNLTFKLTGKEEITVSAPANMDITLIKKMVRVNRDKIDRLIEEDKERVTYDNPHDLSYIYLFGEKIPVVKCREKSHIFEGKFYLNIEKDPLLEIEKLYRETLEKYIPAKIKAFGDRLNIYPTEVKTRKMCSRWGTCYQDRKLIILNIFLSKREKNEIDYVIAHEMAHLLVPNHSKDFYALLQKIMPEYREIRSKMGRV